MQLAVCPGSFDPVTNGHLDIIERASKVFDKVIVAVGVNPKKVSSFTADERVEMIRKVTSDLPNVEVDHSGELLAEYAREKGNCVIVKGLRAGSDFENEFQMALINHKINQELDTVFLTAEHQFTYLSSSMVKELAFYNVELSGFLPDAIIPDVQKRIYELRQGGNPK
jgi:pantetheine-phosphate adenylyltransferase